MNELWIYLMLALAAFACSAMSVIAFHYDQSIFRAIAFKKWNPLRSNPLKIKQVGCTLVKYIQPVFIGVAIYLGHLTKAEFGFWTLIVYIITWEIFFETGNRSFIVK